MVGRARRAAIACSRRRPMPLCRAMGSFPLISAKFRFFRKWSVVAEALPRQRLEFPLAPRPLLASLLLALPVIVALGLAALEPATDLVRRPVLLLDAAAVHDLDHADQVPVTVGRRPVCTLDDLAPIGK